MTKQEAIEFLQLGVPSSDAGNKSVIANRCLQKAIHKFGRMKGVDWNVKAETVTLTSGRGLYDVGKNLLGDSDEGWGISEIWMTDQPGNPIYLVSLDDFNECKRGTTDSGRPVFACMYSDERKLEFYPTPASAYSIWVLYRKDIKNFEQIPSIYHDALLDYGLLCLKALYSSDVAMQLAGASFKEVQEDSLIIWHGNTIRMRNNMTSYPNSGGGKQYDSQNLRGA